MVAQWWAALLLISLPTNRIHRPVVAPVTLTLTRWHIYQLTWIFWRCTCIPNIIVSAHSSQNLEPKHDTPMHFFAVVILTRWPWYINLTYDDDDDDVCVCVCVTDRRPGASCSGHSSSCTWRPWQTWWVLKLSLNRARSHWKLYAAIKWWDKAFVIVGIGLCHEHHCMLLLLSSDEHNGW